MKKFFTLFALLLPVGVFGQTVINQKGTRIIVDSSKWKRTNSVIYSKDKVNVGIGTTNPSATLEVNGTVEIDTVNGIGNDITYRSLVWNTTTRRIETNGNNDKVNKTVVNVGSSGSSTFYTLTGTKIAAYEIKVMVENNCESASYNKFLATGSNFNSRWALNFIAGMSALGVPTVNRPNVTTVATVNPVISCTDGGNGTAFDYTLSLNPATGQLTITNNGNISRNYSVIIEKIFD